MNWISIKDKKPDFNGYEYVAVKIEKMNRIYTITTDKIDDECIVDTAHSIIWTNCINHSLECGSHHVTWDEIEYWIPLYYPPNMS